MIEDDVPTQSDITETKAEVEKTKVTRSSPKKAATGLPAGSKRATSRRYAA